MLMINYLTLEEYDSCRKNVYISRLNAKLTLINGIHEIRLGRREIHRLAAPYKSNCTNEGNLFSNINSADSNEETCALNYMYQECGVVVDAWVKYAPQKVLPYNATKYDSRENCLDEVITLLVDKAIPDCSTKLPCYEVNNYVEDYFYFEDSRKQKNIEIHIYFSSPIVTDMEEILDYTFSDFLGPFGGFVGVCIGMSFVSVIELIVYAVCFLVEKVKVFYRSRMLRLSRNSAP